MQVCASNMVPTLLAYRSSPLMTQVKLAGGKALDHRVAMSAMTRLRMSPRTELPNDLTSLYYEQRASKVWA